MNIISIIIAIILFSIIVIFHELGHFLLAKANGIKVNEFCLGLGPTLFGIQKGETKYSIKLLPFGGACIMEGEDEIYESIDEYLKSLKPLPSPYLQNGKLSAKAKRGKKIFEENCASCHSGQYYTDQKQYKVDWTTGPDKGLPMDVPALNECWRICMTVVAIR